MEMEQFSNALLDDLFVLRQRIRDREKRKTGRTPIVCPDEALHEMVRLMPRKPSDFRSITGIGQAFVENYAEDFLKLLTPTATDYSERTQADVEGTLRELSKKLININKSNRMLFLP
ncbi:MAG: HRDC domain-containing protein, partial [Clostridia bacterium]|nr:HRDC domain-containing protein [Clostridia bacterium]